MVARCSLRCLDIPVMSCITFTVSKIITLILVVLVKELMQRILYIKPIRFLYPRVFISQHNSMYKWIFPSLPIKDWLPLVADDIEKETKRWQVVSKSNILSNERISEMILAKAVRKIYHWKEMIFDFSWLRENICLFLSLSLSILPLYFSCPSFLLMDLVMTISK